MLIIYNNYYSIQVTEDNRMKFLRKIKRIITFRYISWIIYFISYAALLLVSVAPLFDKNADILTSDPDFFYWLLRILTVSVGLNFILQYFIFRRNDKAFSEFDKSLNDLQMEILSPDVASNKMDMMTLSKTLNHVLQNLKEKNERLKDEIEKNNRLSENISEFYRQMRTLRDAELIFDFFEYDVNASYFTFISGMITALSGENETTEIMAEDLFKNFQFSIKLTDYYSHVERCIEEECDMDFECSVKGKDGKIHWLKFWGRPTQDKTRITGAVTDITREVNIRIAEKERIIHDNITGFYNRNALSEVGGKAIAECKDDEHVVFVYIGLTKYQKFQERFGMVSGNNYIRVCAEVMKKFITEDMIPIRWWGSDFLVIVKGVKDLKVFEREAAAIADKIGKYVGEVDGIAVTFPMVMGYAASKLHGNTPSELLEFAAFAEHEALKEVAMSPNEFNYDRFEQSHKATLRRTLIKDIIDTNQLTVVFQPILSLRTGELFGFEALSRPTNPAYRNILELIDDAEASGHYVILERRMVYNALDAYMARAPKYRDHYLFINTAPYSTLDEKDYNDIRDRYLSHMKVVFEVVERNRMDPDAINLRRSFVKKAGAKFALDDFGSGYSNHLALLALEPDFIKIDRELVRGINEDLRKQHMLEDIISYARYRGARVLAEGVETQEELETLCRMGVDFVQGYFTGMPDKTITEPDIKAKRIIKGIIRNKNIDLRQLYIIMEKSLAIINEDHARRLSVIVYLMIKLGRRLHIDEDRFTNLIITTIFHKAGILFTSYKDLSSSESDEENAHSIFAYLLFKEFSPYPEFAEIILYNNIEYGNSKIIDDIPVPDEAYLLSLAADIAEVIINSREKDINKKVAERIGEKSYKPEYKKILEQLYEENVLNHIKTDEYKVELLSYIGAIKLSKAEIMSLLRTLVYAVTFRFPNNFSHARTMETIAGMLGQITKQNWNTMEKVRAAALLYNIGMLTFNEKSFEKVDSPLEFHSLLTGAVKKINMIFEEAELIDITGMFNAMVGAEILSENHMLMVKDIISGANMIKLADVLASLMDQKCQAYDTSCRNILVELREISKTEDLYLPMIELTEEYIEDIEARVKSSQADIIKRYHNVISEFERLRPFIIDHADN